LEFDVSEKPRAAALSGVSLNLGLLSCKVSLVPMKRSKKSAESMGVRLVNVCPVCVEATPLDTFAVCSVHPDEHGHIGPSDADKAVKRDGELVKVSAESVADAKTPKVSARKIELSVFHAEQVEQWTVPSGANAYWLRPEDAQFYGLLHEIVARRDFAFIGEVTVKGVTKLYRAIVRGDGVALVELVRPDELHEPEPVITESDGRLSGQGEALVAALVREFVPEEWHNEAQARLRELRDSAEPGMVLQEVPVVADVEGLLAEIRKLKSDAA
jgi:hypothetical protein